LEDPSGPRGGTAKSTGRDWSASRGQSRVARSQDNRVWLGRQTAWGEIMSPGGEGTIWTVGDPKGRPGEGLDSGRRGRMGGEGRMSDVS